MLMLFSIAVQSRSPRHLKGSMLEKASPKEKKEKSGAKVSTPIRKACHSRKNNRWVSEPAATWQVTTQVNKYDNTATLSK